MVWNQAQVDRAYWVVAKGTPRAELARKFIQIATSGRAAGGLLQAGQRTGRSTRAAFQFIGENDAKLMPTYPAHYKVSFEQDILNAGIDLEARNQALRSMDRELAVSERRRHA